MSGDYDVSEVVFECLVATCSGLQRLFDQVLKCGILDLPRLQDIVDIDLDAFNGSGVFAHFSHAFMFMKITAVIVVHDAINTTHNHTVTQKAASSFSFIPVFRSCVRDSFRS